jgi:tetratricopeptide (TPR) repeat protein
MPVPPRDIPEDLSDVQYMRLAVRYAMMGWRAQAEVAIKRASALRPVIEQASTSEPEEEAPIDSDSAVANAVLEVIMEAPNQSPEQLLDSVRTKLTEMEVPTEEIEKTVQALAEAWENTPQEVQLASDVPEGLSAEEYLELGMQYKAVGWTEQARDALQYSIEIDGRGETGKFAATYLRTKVPRHPVPMMAVQRNVKGYNQRVGGEWQSARATFEELICDYPDFEWPYGNLGSLLVTLGEFEEARRILEQALEINPFYLNALLHMARLHAANDDFDACYRCLDRAEEIDPDDMGAVEIRELIKTHLIES